MALRLRYEIDTPERLREHLHVVDGAGYFFFPEVSAAEGAGAVLQVSFTGGAEGVALRGQVWARPAQGGVWLELPGAARFLASPARPARIATEQLVLAEGAGQPALLCRLRDVSESGARLGAAGSEVGEVGGRVRITLPEAGPLGGQLEGFGRVAWAAGAEVGVEWLRGDLASRAAVRRLLELAEQEWEGARSVSHSRGCRCMKARGLPEVLLLG